MGRVGGWNSLVLLKNSRIALFFHQLFWFSMNVDEWKNKKKMRQAINSRKFYSNRFSNNWLSNIELNAILRFVRNPWKAI